MITQTQEQIQPETQYQAPLSFQPQGPIELSQAIHQIFSRFNQDIKLAPQELAYLTPIVQKALQEQNLTPRQINALCEKNLYNIDGPFQLVSLDEIAPTIYTSKILKNGELHTSTHQAKDARLALIQAFKSFSIALKIVNETAYFPAHSSKIISYINVNNNNTNTQTIARASDRSMTQAALKAIVNAANIFTRK